MAITRLATRDVVKTENCQRCHEPFAFHGGIRMEIKVCVQCHTPQLTDPDNSGSDSREPGQSVLQSQHADPTTAQPA